MTEPAYPAARIVAPKVAAHFAHHAEEARRRGRASAVTAPDADTIEAIIDAAFWASLRREESYVPKISLAFLPPEAAHHPLLFEQPLPLQPDKLLKLISLKAILPQIKKSIMPAASRSSIRKIGDP